MSTGRQSPLDLRIVVAHILSGGRSRQGFYFLIREFPPPSLWQPAERQRAHGNPHEAQNRHLESGQQSPYLPVPSFIEHDLEPCIASAGSDTAGGFRGQPLAVNDGAALEIRQQRGVGYAVHLHVVCFFGAGGRVGDSCGPRGIVAEQQKTLAGSVQPPHRRKPRQGGAFEASVNGVPAPFVVRGWDEASWLVQHDHEARGRSGLVAVDGDEVPTLDHWKLGVADLIAVDAYPPFAYPSTGLSARTDSQFGDDAGDAVPCDRRRLCGSFFLHPGSIAAVPGTSQMRCDRSPGNLRAVVPLKSGEGRGGCARGRREFRPSWRRRRPRRVLNGASGRRDPAAAVA